MTDRQTKAERRAEDAPEIDAPQDPARSPSTREDEIAGSEGCGSTVGWGTYRGPGEKDTSRRKEENE